MPLLNALRTWGMATSAVLMTGALALSWQAPPLAQAQSAVAQAQSAPLGFLVRFRGDGPIARAQRLATRGRVAEGTRQVTRELARQTEFAGLCFDRFTAGAAEIVLRTCTPVPASERAGVAQAWLVRLRAMPAVEYVDANAQVAPTRGPG